MSLLLFLWQLWYLNLGLKAELFSNTRFRFPVEPKQNFSSPLYPNDYWIKSSLLLCGHPGVLSLQIKWPGREVTHLHLGPRLRVNGTIFSLLHTSSLRGIIREKFTFKIFIYIHLSVNAIWIIKLQVLGRTNRLLSFHCNFSAWYDK
jgi:hypothetical protein